MTTVASKKKDPYADYDLDDWQWEFLRRNKRYRRRYRAIQRAEQRGWGYEVNGEYHPISDIWALDLRSRLSLSCPPTIDHPDESDHALALPSPDIPRAKFEYSPIRRGGAYVTNIRTDDEDDTELGKLFRGEIFTVDRGIPDDCKIYVEIDARCKLEMIVADLRKELPKYLRGGRDQLKLYKSYLEVWDLRRKDKTADEIAPKLWPDENATKGGRGRYGDKGALIQRVYDYEDAANDLIEKSFPAKQPRPKIQK